MSLDDLRLGAISDVGVLGDIGVLKVIQVSVGGVTVNT